MTDRRYTSADVRHMFGQYADLIREHGLIRPGHRLELQEGSPSAGRGWRIYEVQTDGPTGLAEPLIGSNYLGRSKADAWNALADRRRIIADVLHCQNEADACEVDHGIWWTVGAGERCPGCRAPSPRPPAVDR